MACVNDELRAFVLAEAEKVAKHRRFGFYRWMLNIIEIGYDPRDDLMGDYHGMNC